MVRDTGLGIGVAIAVPVFVGLVLDVIGIGAAVGIVAGVVVATRWPPRPSAVTPDLHDAVADDATVDADG